MNFEYKNYLYILLFLLILFVSLNVVSAHDNSTQIAQGDLIPSENLQDEISVVDISAEEISQKVDTKIVVKDKDYFYKDKNNLVSYLKDSNGTPIKNKQLDVFLSGKHYSKTTDGSGKITLDLNLKPNTYKLNIKFAGDENFTASDVNSIIKVKKPSVAIKMNNFNTYEKSSIFFKATVYNKVTKNPIEGVKVLFKVYSTKTNKLTKFYATTDNDGVATLSKSFKKGSYKVSAQIKDSKNKKYISYKNSNKNVTMKVKTYAGEDCCSFFLQVSDNESVGGFRRDNTAMTTITVKEYELGGIPLVRHTNANGFVHLMVFANGWIVGNGGLDGYDFIKSMEKMAVDMIKSNQIKMSYLKKIYTYKRNINFGHFSIKAPDGRYAVVWKNKIITGKLKPGEFSCSPNFKEYYRHSTYKQYSTDPAKAAIKVGSTDRYGVNRRQVVVLHWKATTDKNYKTTASIKAYAANDNGRFVGVSSARLVDNVVFKGKMFRGYSLPKTPNMRYLGYHSFGNIDQLIKTPTTVKAPKVTNKVNLTKYFKVTVKDKNTNKAVKYTQIKVKVSNENMSKTYTIKTDKNGVAKLNTKNLLIGIYKVVLSPANNKYLISGKSQITIINSTAI